MISRSNEKCSDPPNSRSKQLAPPGLGKPGRSHSGGSAGTGRLAALLRFATADLALVIRCPTIPAGKALSAAVPVEAPDNGGGPSQAMSPSDAPADRSAAPRGPQALRCGK